MKRIKLILIGSAILLGVGGAWASSCDICEVYQQYKFNGVTYVPVGEYGYDWYCQSAAQTCTWYQPNPMNPNTYLPCRTGQYTPLW